MKNANNEDNLNEYRRLFFLPSELHVSQIIDNPKIQKPGSLKFEPKVLPLQNQKLHKTESFLHVNKDEYEKGVELIKANCNVPADKSAGSIKLKLHLLNYIGTLCSESSKLADSFVNVELYKDLLTIVRNGHNLEM
jgi:serine/threonine-protein kinase ULK4